MVRAKETRFTYRIAKEDTGTMRHLCMPGWSGLAGTAECRRTSSEISWDESVEENGSDDRHITRKLKGIVLRTDKRRMEGLREDVGVRESLMRKLVRSRLKWACHVERMEWEWLAKRAEALKVEV